MKGGSENIATKILTPRGYKKTAEKTEKIYGREVESRCNFNSLPYFYFFYDVFQKSVYASVTLWEIAFSSCASVRFKYLRVVLISACCKNVQTSSMSWFVCSYKTLALYFRRLCVDVSDRPRYSVMYLNCFHTACFVTVNSFPR